MKKLCLCLTILATLLFFAGCGGSKKGNKNDEPDTGETVTDEDAVDTEPTGDTEPTDTEPADDSDTEPTEKPDEDGEKTPEELNKECQELDEESFYSEEDGTCLIISTCGEKPEAYADWNPLPDKSDYAGLCFEYYENGSWPEEGYCDTVYSEEPGPCHFVCWEGTEWNADTNSCDIIDDNTSECRQAGGEDYGGAIDYCFRVEKDCGDKPANSEWIVPKYGDYGKCFELYENGSWPDESYCDTACSMEPFGCHFKCNEYFYWDADTNSCVLGESECRKAGGEDYGGAIDFCFRISGNCAEKPAHTDWNFPQYGLYGLCYEEYINGSWPEEGYCDTVYSEEPGGCHFKCDKTAIWRSSKSICEAISYTGLIWSDKSVGTMTIDDATAYCENLEEDGFTDWVLPTIDELKTIVQHCHTIMPGGECQLSEFCTSTSPCAVSNDCFCTKNPTPEEGYYSVLGDSERLWSKTKTSSGKTWSMMFNVSKAGPSISTADARVRCVRHYCGDDKVWGNTNSCVTPETREQACDSVNAYSEWNTVSSINQTWNSYTWTWEPPSTPQYAEIPSDTECRFKCKDNGHKESWKCVSNTKATECGTLPQHTEWNGPSTVTQTWDSATSSWTPDVPEPTYSESYGTTLCGYKCTTDYGWNDLKSECAQSRKANCLNLPQNAHWTGSGTVSQSWDSATSSWTPEIPEPTYKYGTCAFLCDPGSYWDRYEEKCVSSYVGGKYWSEVSSENMTYSEAVAYCQNLADGPWQLPTINQLRTLVRNCSYTETGGECPVTDSNHGPFGTQLANCECSSDFSGMYSVFGDTYTLWSITDNNFGSSYWVINFIYAEINFYSDTNNVAAVRCIRN